MFEGVEDIGEAVHRVNTEADVVWVDGHSDYGHAFEVFWQRYGKEIGPKTTVLILGDARNNYHASQSWVLKEIEKRARHLYWLNPEPKSLLGHRRLDRRRVRQPLRRHLRVPQPPPAREVRRLPRLSRPVPRREPGVGNRSRFARLGSGRSSSADLAEQVIRSWVRRRAARSVPASTRPTSRPGFSPASCIEDPAWVGPRRWRTDAVGMLGA